jgi:hypothetical protein
MGIVIRNGMHWYRREWWALLSFAMLISVGCTKPNHRESDMSKEAAFHVAVEYIEKVRPQWKDSLKLPHEVTKEGDCWIVTFVLPNDQQGGTPTIYVDKQCKQVVKAFHEQ